MDRVGKVLYNLDYYTFKNWKMVGAVWLTVLGIYTLENWINGGIYLRQQWDILLIVSCGISYGLLRMLSLTARVILKKAYKKAITPVRVCVYLIGYGIYTVITIASFFYFIYASSEVFILSVVNITAKVLGVN